MLGMLLGRRFPRNVQNNGDGNATTGNIFLTIGGIAIITVGEFVGDAPWNYTQPFGKTPFSLANPGYYAYGEQYCLDRGTHPGVDIGVAIGTQLYCPVEGEVIIAGNDKYFTDERFGKAKNSGQLKIRTDSDEEVIIGHMEHIAVELRARVTLRQAIGRSGTSNGPHAHVEIRLPNHPECTAGLKIVDPMGTVLRTRTPRWPRPVKNPIRAEDYDREGTRWLLGFSPGGEPPFTHLLGRGSGAFVYNAELPEYDVASDEASVTAILTSGDMGAATDVTLFVNDTNCGTQRVQSTLAQYQWRFPETVFRPNDHNILKFAVLPESGLRNGLSIFNGVVAPMVTGILVSIPFEQVAPPAPPVYDAWFVSQRVPTLMVADGRPYPVSIKMYNSGDQVWRPDRIRLRSENPPDNWTWGQNRVDLSQRGNVEPKSDAIFSFDVTPQVLGEQLFRWGVIRENVGPFGQKNAPVWVMVAKDALFLRQSMPATIVAGTTQPVSVTFRNIGTVPWTRDTNYRLGSQGPANNTTWGLHRVELPREKVDPNTEVTFEFPITAPTSAGKYNFQWQVLREQVAWLGQPLPAFEIRVMPPLTKAAVFVSQNVANPVPPGAVQMVAVTMRNVGTQTWTAAAQFKLGSQNPGDNFRWGTNRIPLPHDVPPNAEVTFTFGITARGEAGTWNFQWQMLQEDVEWFGQLTPNIELRVAPQQPPLLDLYFMKTKNTTQGKIEAHTATNDSQYTTGLSSVTRFSSTDADNGWFGMHRNGDIYFVKTKNTASGKVEVFTATASSGYTQGISAATRFNVSDGANGRFGMLPNGDLYFIKTRNTGTGTIEAFTALGPTYTTGLSIPTRFAATDAINGWFGMLPTSDVYFIKTKNTGSGKMEAYTATSASGYTTGIQTSTRFANTNAENGTFGMLTNGDVYFIKTKNTASGEIEAFTATRSSNYASGLDAASRFTIGEGTNGVWGIV